MLTYEGEQHVIAAAQHILKALGATENLSDDFRRVLTELEAHLTAMAPMDESKGGRFTEVEERLKCAEKTVIRWKSDPSLIWDSAPMESSKYLQAVNEIHKLMSFFGNLSINENGKQRELANRAQHVLQIAMSRLEEELYHILLQHKQNFEPQHMSFRSCAENAVCDGSFVSVEDEMVEGTSQRNRNCRESMDFTVDLVDPRVIPDIQSIANVMFTCNYGREFCGAFVSNRKDALDGYLCILEMEKLSIENVLNLEWNSLNKEIKKWMWAMKIIIRVYLAGEKWFCDQILGNFGSVSSYCFVESSKVSVLQLLNFGQAIAVGPHKPEKLNNLLDMYEVLVDLQPDIDGLFLEEIGYSIKIEFGELLNRLGDSARMTFMGFGNAVASNASVQPFPRGGIHHLTRYVMNYIMILTEYYDTLSLLLKDQAVGDQNAVLPETDNGQDVSLSASCPVVSQLQSITSILESNLIDKSKLYKDDSLRHIFLMNNLHYIVQKAKGSELRIIFGDEWIRKHTAKFRKHATCYERATWSSIISLLRDDGMTTFKERCKRFSNAFDVVYRRQTQWCIPDPGLRDDLQISTSQKVIHAYQTFLGPNNRNVSDKHIKYTIEALQKLLLDLFVGSSRSLRNSRRQ